MSTTFTQLTQGGLHIGPDRSNAGRDPEAWKKMLGQKPVSARLMTLPDTKINRNALLSSTMFQVGVAALIVVIPMFFPQKLVNQIAYVVTPIVAPETAVPLAPKPPVIHAKIQPRPEPVPDVVPPPVQVARIVAPRPIVAPKPRPVDIRTPDAPKLDQPPLIEAKLDQPASEPIRPREPVKTNNLSTGSAAPATVNLPLNKVQTGGFGDPNGLPGAGDPNKRANIARQGSPLLPDGPGYGNGTGGANGVRGTVASTGFGNGIAVPPAGGTGPARGPIRAGGFASAAPTGEAPKARVADAPAAVQPVEILAKPNPVYSEEARKLAIEGDVLVEVVFPASGPVRVVRVVKGLGHGLDESAVRAAEQIRFKPALQNGSAVDFPATVHIVFQLAF